MGSGWVLHFICRWWRWRGACRAAVDTILRKEHITAPELPTSSFTRTGRSGRKMPLLAPRGGRFRIRRSGADGHRAGSIVVFN